MPIGFEPAPANVPERRAAAEMLARLDLHGYTVIADKGFAGEQFEQIMAGLGARLLRPDRNNERRRRGIAGPRPPVDRIDLLDLQRPTQSRTPRRSHHPRGLRRAALRMLALAAGLVHNQQIDDPGRHFAAYGH